MASAPTTLVFGGSFDPPHLAHLRLPRQVANAVGADRVLFVPAAQAPHKVGQVPTDGHHRAAMLALALADAPWAEISLLELDRAKAALGAPSYTVDTLEALAVRHPGRKWRLLIGSDQLLIFPKWRQWRRVAELAEPAVMVRAPHTRTEVLAQLPPELDPAEWAPRLVEAEAMDVSSTELRRRLRAGESTEGLLAPQVAAYIMEHGLYRR